MDLKRFAFLALVVVGAAVALKFLAGKASGLLDVKDVKIGVYNFLAVGVMASLFIILAKVVTAKYPVPGLSEAVHSI